MTQITVYHTAIIVDRGASWELRDSSRVALAEGTEDRPEYETDHPAAKNIALPTSYQDWTLVGIIPADPDDQFPVTTAVFRAEIVE